MKFLTAGETHGKCLIAIIEGMPSNLCIDTDKINKHLALRQSGYGRGLRMKIERDKVEVLSGVRQGVTLGSPIALKIQNKDWENWKDVMATEPTQAVSNAVTKPRPGHADLSGSIKYHHQDIRNVLERASARETAIRTAVGCVAEQLINHFGIKVFSHVTQIGPHKADPIDEISDWHLSASQLRCASPAAEADMIAYIDNAKVCGDSVGGVFEVMVFGLPVGLGSYVHWDRKLDGKIAGALMSIQGIKGVEFGEGFSLAGDVGSKCHDQIFFSHQEGYYRQTNRAGGIEGGMTNGQPLVVRCAMKPIPTLYKPLSSVDIITKESFEASVERSDICAVPAASVVGHSVVAWEIACALIEKLGGDSLDEMMKAWGD